MVDTAAVKIWGELAGAVSWIEEKNYAVFEYAPEYLEKGPELAPLTMPHSKAKTDPLFLFNLLNKDTFLGLPGMLADSLPDDFGNAVINAWLEKQGRVAGSMNPIERLCYVGKRGMGALEYEPVMREELSEGYKIEVDELARLADVILNRRDKLKTNYLEKTDALNDIIRVGSSAGGARPKAIIAWNEETGEIRSGQSRAPDDFDYWIMKFDGVQSEKLGNPAGFGRIEYAYYLMAKAAGISMMPCRLFEEAGRAHFMTKRFDRTSSYRKLHVQTLCGIAHFDYNQAGRYSYEDAFQVMRRLKLPFQDAVEQYRRMVFNILARNQDDHTKNISFVMFKSGKWRLSPAYDLTFSFNPDGKWTHMHQMSLNGKREHFSREDLIDAGKAISIKKPYEIIEEVESAIAGWERFAGAAGVINEHRKYISKHLRRL
ncbi:type II toxin-antitoxin system HipA family toxin [Balneola sp. MJW-20]|uniref:type II toxin-antitoxin system HipA family toxin n=1 Tax=Gracilimonas aurantiaca TaxID=3234185 RepID=UPI0034657426